jgi:hypothetical protein
MNILPTHPPKKKNGIERERILRLRRAKVSFLWGQISDSQIYRHALHMDIDSIISPKIKMLNALPLMK